MTRQSNRTAVVIGGTRGIGAHLVRHFAEEGYSVGLCARDENAAELMAARASAEFKVEALGFGLDATDPAQCSRFATQIDSTFGCVDVLYANAAVFGPVGDIEAIDLKRWSDALTKNLLLVLQPVQAFLPLLRCSSAASILTMSGGGLGGSTPIRNASSYLASKAAVVALVETIAEDLRSMKITFNAIAPGFFPTGFMEEAIAVGKDVAGEALFTDASRSSDEDVSPTLEQLTKLIDFLVSDAARGVTGRTLSARWDSPSQILEYCQNQDSYKMRRIDNVLFGERFG